MLWYHYVLIIVQVLCFGHPSARAWLVSSWRASDTVAKLAYTLHVSVFMGMCLAGVPLITLWCVAAVLYAIWLAVFISHVGHMEYRMIMVRAALFNR